MYLPVSGQGLAVRSNLLQFQLGIPAAVQTRLDDSLRDEERLRTELVHCKHVFLAVDGEPQGAHGDVVAQLAVRRVVVKRMAVRVGQDHVTCGSK